MDVSLCNIGLFQSGDCAAFSLDKLFDRAEIFFCEAFSSHWGTALRYIINDAILVSVSPFFPTIATRPKSQNTPSCIFDLEEKCISRKLP